MVSEHNDALRVLLIEDDVTDARIIDLLLGEAKSASFCLRLAANLQEGLATLQTEHVDVVLLDLNLPDSVGLDTLAALQRSDPGVPVVVLTGIDDEQLGLDAARLGAQDYLIKAEVDTNLLVRSLRYAFERSQAGRRLREREAHLRLLVEQIPAVLWTTDTNLIFTSSVGRELAGLRLEPNQLTGTSLEQYLGQDEEQGHVPIEMHQQALAGKTTSGDVQWRDYWYHAHVEPLYDAAGRIIGTIGVALDITDVHHMTEDIEAARRIQQHLLPEQAPSRPGLDIAGRCQPAAQCSGDYYDYIAMHNDRLAVVLADVSGHGFAPAIVASSIRSYLRAAAALGRGVHEMLTVANWLMTRDTDGDKFVTVVCCELDPNNQSLIYTSAGHCSYLLRASGRIKVLEATSLPLGIHEDESIVLSSRMAFQPGDVLLFVTDGIIEALSNDGEQFGRARALGIVARHREKTAAEIIEALHDAVRSFIAPRTATDDVTAVVVKATPR